MARDCTGGERELCERAQPARERCERGGRAGGRGPVPGTHLGRLEARSSSRPSLSRSRATGAPRRCCCCAQVRHSRCARRRRIHLDRLGPTLWPFPPLPRQVHHTTSQERRSHLFPHIQHPLRPSPCRPPPPPPRQLVALTPTTSGSRQRCTARTSPARQRQGSFDASTTPCALCPSRPAVTEEL